ncbi:MAG: DUF4368 domain-containing protein [Bacteroidales bacterium]|nr:DUF4368 domain-containing protein [Bacteroidales bacterium]
MAVVGRSHQAGGQHPALFTGTGANGFTDAVDDVLQEGGTGPLFGGAAYFFVVKNCAPKNAAFTAAFGKHFRACPGTLQIVQPWAGNELVLCAPDTAADTKTGRKQGPARGLPRRHRQSAVGGFRRWRPARIQAAYQFPGSGLVRRSYHVNTINKNICFFSCSNYVKDYRGSCPTRHYVRADAIEQVVKLELQRMAQFLRDDEPMFADILERKSNREIAEEKKRLEGELQKARMRTETVSRLYKKAFEKNAEGLLSNEGFLQITHEYDVEQLALKAKIPQLREQIAEAERQAANKDKFIAAIRKFMQMDELTAPLLRELIDYIEMYETQGIGKSRTQRIAIHYRFVGCIDIPAAPLTSRDISETRQGVAVEYIPA